MPHERSLEDQKILAKGLFGQKLTIHKENINNEIINNKDKKSQI